MNRTFLEEHRLQTIVIAITLVFMLLNVFLPLNFSFAVGYPFMLTVTLEKTAYKLKEPVNITLTLINIGEENITFQSFYDFLVDFIVYDTNFVQVYQYWKEHGIVDTLHLIPPFQPGEKWTFPYIWYQENGLVYQGLSQDPPAYYKKVPPGTYYIIGIFDSTSNKVRLETPAVKITVTGE